MPSERERSHTCHAVDCEKRVPPAMLMCYPHWRMVPAALKREVWATYLPGQENLDGTAPVTAEYLDAATRAINAVAEKEGKPTRRLIREDTGEPTSRD